ASVSNNDVVKLELRPEDRYENAWKRELMGGYSKQQLIELCGVGEHTISDMRRAKRAFRGDPDIPADFTARFREALEVNNRGGVTDVAELSWWKVKQALKGTEKREYDLEAQALTLAKYLRSAA